MSEPTAYPLTWPYGRKRASRPMGSQFKTGLPVAIKNVRKSLEMFGRDTNKKVTHVVISSNVTLGVNSPTDPGVAVYFHWDERQVCIAVDRYSKLQCNLQAIHHILEARRTEMRHGGIEIVRASFEGFKALPAPSSHRHWSEVLGLPRSARVDQVKAKAKELAKKAHPDAGGTTEAMAEINAARDQAIKDITG